MGGGGNVPEKPLTPLPPFPFKAIRKRDGMAAMAALRAEPCRPLPGTAKERNRRERT